VTNSRRKALKPEEAAEMMGKPVGTLNNWRYRNYGPAYVKVGHSVRYFEDDLVAFLEANRVEPREAR
jgi:hypothetical protein